MTIMPVLYGKQAPCGYTTYFMPYSTEHQIYHAHVKMPTIVGILKFISMINTTLESLKARSLYSSILVFYEQLKFHAQLS